MTKILLPLCALLLSLALAPAYFRGVQRSSALYLAGRTRSALLLTGVRLALVTALALAGAHFGGAVTIAMLAGFVVARARALRAGVAS